MNSEKPSKQWLRAIGQLLVFIAAMMVVVGAIFAIVDTFFPGLEDVSGYIQAVLEVASIVFAVFTLRSELTETQKLEEAEFITSLNERFSLLSNVTFASMHAVPLVESLRVAGLQLFEVLLRDGVHVHTVGRAQLRDHPQAIAQLLDKVIDLELVALQRLLVQPGNLSGLRCEAEDAVPDHVWMRKLRIDRPRRFLLVVCQCHLSCHVLPAVFRQNFAF